ncbi:uncharacterized protein LOC108928850 isoform X2 [Scleropages formosus]|uniref:uncharacterized protein LOC108928850 isoform X2 n=1 Tax=Scleropages formosus TaxID=113540 RepID=UPI0010FAAD49|nr:uncharacterized protein LOC108928850 isoform X2 [Scleropages formosus]
MLKVTASLLFLCPWPTVVTVPSAGSSEQPPNPEFTSQAVVCLIGAVGRRWGLYGPRERAQLFQGVQRELEDHGYVLPVERIRRKWNNLIVTYKRVKDRSCGTGKAKTSWEYFELMDAMLGDTVGAKSSGTPSASMVNISNGAQETPSTSLTATIKTSLQSSSLIPACSQVATVTPASPPQSTAPHPSSTAPGYADPQAPSPSRGSPPDRHDRLRARRKPRQGPADVAASFLLQQQRQAEDCSTMLCDFLAGQEDRARLQEMRLVRHESRERRRERREGKMADALCRIATALELLSSKQDTVIALLQRLADKQRNSFQIWKKIWKESLRFSLIHRKSRRNGGSCFWGKLAPAKAPLQTPSLGGRHSSLT